MLQFIIQGRGGQGAQMAGKILADMYFKEGRHVLSYATYGGARRGTPVSSLLRVDERPIRLRCDIDEPDVIVCFDPSLLANGDLLKGASLKTKVLINSGLPVEKFSALGDFQVATVDAKQIAGRSKLGRIVNTTMVGAAMGLVGYENAELLGEIVGQMSPVKSRENVAACLEGYRTMKKGSC